MSEKRKRAREDGEQELARDKKKPNKGFSVGPQNLPDGVYKRKNQSIKQSLIDKAKIKKDYAKLRKQGKIPEEDEALPIPASLAIEEEAAEREEEPSTAPHPDRQEMIAHAAEHPDEEEEVAPAHRERRPRQRKPKAVPFKREHEEAQQRKAEAEERRRAREEAERERQAKIEERERFRRVMAKARTGGPNGQRKLGRESTVLLEKVKRMVGQGNNTG